MSPEVGVAPRMLVPSRVAIGQSQVAWVQMEVQGSLWSYPVTWRGQGWCLCVLEAGVFPA